MTIFTITTLTDNKDGTGLAFDAKSDFGSPSETELLMLSDYLTPRGLDLLQDILAKQVEPLEKEPSKKQADGGKGRPTKRAEY